MPAKAGIQAGGMTTWGWMPAFAGMTIVRSRNRRDQAVTANEYPVSVHSVPLW